MLLWLALEARAMSSGEILGAIPPVVMDTGFGHVLTAQFALLVLTAIAPVRFAILPALAALAAQAGHSHAYAMSGIASQLFGSELLHLLAAGTWLGGLIPLLLAIRLAPKAGAVAARRFSPVGIASVAMLAATALFQGSVLVGSLPALIGTAYGWAVLGKLTLFAALVLCAALNRTRYTAACVAGRPRMLVRTVGIETALGLAVILVAATLSGLEPGMHMQPVWPFTWRPSLEAATEDADIRREVIAAALALGGALLLLAAAFLLRSWRRWGAAVAALAIAWLAAPHLGPLLVDAFPTSYFHSPTGFTADSIIAGARLYPDNCASCHGVDGTGHGSAAAGLPVPPADLTAEHLWMHGDGELFWWLAQGMRTPEGQVAMPGFAGVLSDDERWALIDFIRARNAGLTEHRTGRWTPPVRAPGFQARCAAGRAVTLAELHGRDVRLVIGAAPDATGVLTVLATTDAAVHPDAHRCVTDDETVPTAYAIIAGIAPDHVAGAQFLIDPDGWLRAVQASGTIPGWGDDARDLAAELRHIHEHPITAGNAAMAM